MKIRVGHGYDVHQLKEGLEFWLGGVKIESKLGALGHSDADVLIHAIIDALLGAANLRDIGYQYPDSKSEYNGVDSKVLLSDTVKKIRDKGFEISNVDSVICLQEPKIGKYITHMKEVLSKIMEIDVEDISIKATTTEWLGFVGKGEGIASYAVCLLIN